MGQCPDEEETGGGVVIVFTSDSAKRAELFNAMEWITQALKAQRLIVSRHDAEPNSSHSRSAPKPQNKLLHRVIPCNPNSITDSPMNRASLSRNSVT